MLNNHEEFGSFAANCYSSVVTENYAVDFAVVTENSVFAGLQSLTFVDKAAFIAFLPVVVAIAFVVASFDSARIP